MDFGLLKLESESSKAYPKLGYIKELPAWGVPGWLSQSNVQLLILAQAMISGLWNRAPRQAPCWAWSPLEILSLPLPLLPPNLSQKNKKKLKKKKRMVARKKRLSKYD